MAEHTPRPWKIIDEISPTTCRTILGGPGNLLVCTTSEHNPKDAPLLAAAPDLLEACERLLKFNEELCQDVGVSIHYPSAEFARQTIAKAKGR